MFNPNDAGFTSISGSLPDTLDGADAVGDYLVAVEGMGAGRIIEIAAEPITIGRDPEQVLVFADTEISRRHARVSTLAGMVVAEDLKSTNGTFIDGQRITGLTALREGSVLRVGRQLLKYERRSRRDVERSRELSRDLEKASSYLLSLLPAPIEKGLVLTSWRFQPSTQLGGDAFGYYWLEADSFVFYLMDVSGHGVGAAMHSVAVLNVLRQRALPNVDFTDPGAVLSSLNDRFQMDAHDGMYFTMWYGVYRVAARTLFFSTAGHHPAYLIQPDRSTTIPLGMPDLMIGAVPDVAYAVQRAAVCPGSTVHLFSDGVFEIVTNEQQQWGLADFLPHLVAPDIGGVSDAERLYRLVKAQTRGGVFDDDFSLLTVAFP